jgi:hypothetical protein
MQHARQLTIVGIGAESGQQPPIFGALDTRTDDLGSQMRFGRVIHLA